MKILKKICPICVLVALIWLVMLTFKWFGYRVNADLLALLMGGSAVGISYTLANKLSRWTMAWKLIAVPLGLAGMYALLQFAWAYFLVALVAYVIAWWLFSSAGTDTTPVVQPSQSVVDINKELKNCC